MHYSLRGFYPLSCAERLIIRQKAGNFDKRPANCYLFIFTANSVIYLDCRECETEGETISCRSRKNYM